MHKFPTRQLVLRNQLGKLRFYGFRRKKTVFHEVAALSSVIRNREIEKAIYTELAKGERIMILAGAGHMGGDGEPYFEEIGVNGITRQVGGAVDHTKQLSATVKNMFTRLLGGLISFLKLLLKQEQLPALYQKN